MNWVWQPNVQDSDRRPDRDEQQLHHVGQRRRLRRYLHLLNLLCLLRLLLLAAKAKTKVLTWNTNPWIICQIYHMTVLCCFLISCRSWRSDCLHDELCGDSSLNIKLHGLVVSRIFPEQSRYNRGCDEFFTQFPPSFLWVDHYEGLRGEADWEGVSYNDIKNSLRDIRKALGCSFRLTCSDFSSTVVGIT